MHVGCPGDDTMRKIHPRRCNYSNKGFVGPTNGPLTSGHLRRELCVGTAIAPGKATKCETGISREIRL